MRFSVPFLLTMTFFTGVASGGKPIERIELKNGLKVFLCPLDGANQIALVTLYSIGNDHDPEGRSGLGHLVEHVYVTAAAGEGTGRTMQQFMRQYPAGWNAQTGNHHTVIASVFGKKELEQELVDAAARMGDLKVTPADLAREKPRVIAEVRNMFGGKPALAVLNLVRQRARPGPAGSRHGGQPKQVQALTLEEVQRRLRHYYKPMNAVLVLAGGFDKARARDLIQKHFANLPAGRAAPARRPLRKPQSGDVAKVRITPIRPAQSVRVGLGYAAPLPGSDLYGPFLFVVQRMWKTAWQLGTRSPGLTVAFTPLDGPETIAFSTVVEPNETPEAAIGRLESFVAEALKPKLTPEEVLRVNDTFGPYLGTIELPVTAWVQNAYPKAFSIGRRAQLGFDPGELKKALQAVGDEDLRRVAKEVFAPQKRATVIVIPEK